MGRATITGGGEDGLYDISVDIGADRIQAEIAAQQARIDAATAELQTFTTLLAERQTAEAELLAEVEAASAAYLAVVNVGGEALLAASQALTEATAALYEGQKETALVRMKQTAVKFELMSARKALQAKQSVVTSLTSEAWCVDYTLEASGSVATLEVPGEPQQILIAPGGRAPESSDGRLLARQAMTGPQAYWNAAVLPGWQKFKPDYRVGIISEIDYNNDTCKVTLDRAISSAQSLLVNQATVLENVPIEYMTCNAVAFKDGDDVVVQFENRDWTRPKVIGFEHDPQPCCRLAWLFTVPGLLGSNYLPETQPTGDDWYAYQDALFLDDPSRVLGGYLIPVRGATFKERTDKHLNEVTEITAEVIIRDLSNVDEDLYFEIGPNGPSGTDGIGLWLAIRKSPTLSSFLVQNEVVTTFPIFETPNHHLFDCTFWNSGSGYETPLVLRIQISLTQQRLYINEQLMATLNNSYPPGWNRLGYIYLLTPNDADNSTDLVNCTAKWDFICVK